MFSYRFLLKQAWSITKKHRYLWFFGIFASLLATGGEYQIITQGLNNDPGGSFVSVGNFLLYNLFNPSFYEGFRTVIATNPAAFWSLLTVALLALALAVIMLYLAIISQAALVNQSAQIITGKKKKDSLGIMSGLKTERRHFWRVLALNIASSLFISLSFLIVSLPLIFLLLTNTEFLTVAYAFLFVIFVPISLSVALIIKYAIAVRVLENRSFIASLTKGWLIFSNNWLVSLEMAVILFFISFAVGLGTIIIISLFLLPLLAISLMFYLPLLTALSFILILAAMVITASILSSFQIAAWTGLYLQLKDKKGHSKLERMAKRTR